MLVTVILSIALLWRLPIDLPGISTPLDLPYIATSIDQAFGLGFCGMLMNLRHAMTATAGILGGVVGGLVWQRSDAVVIGTLVAGIVARLASLGLLVVAGRLAEGRLRARSDRDAGDLGDDDT